jgi:hypothetical protein
MEAWAIKMNFKLIKQAVSPLSKYHKDTLKEFLRKYNIEDNGDKDSLLNRIESSLYEKSISLESIDDLLNNGRQLVFYWRYRGATAINVIASEDRIINRLERFLPGLQLGMENLEWESHDRPVLCKVWFDDRNRLAFKWVETRRWAKYDSNNLRYINKTERSINFFILNIEMQSAQLFLQELRTHPKINKQDELKLYCSLIGEFLEEDFYNMFIQNSIEPVHRSFITFKDAEIKNWSIKSPTVGELSGNADPEIFVSFLLPFGDFFGNKLDFVWTVKIKPHEKIRVFISLDTQLNSVTIGKCKSVKEKERVLERIIELQPEYNIKSKELKKIAEEKPNMEAILLAIDAFLLKGVKVITAKQLKNWWINTAKIRKVFDEVYRRYPKKFSVGGKKNDVLVIEEINWDGLIGELDKFIEKVSGKKPKGYFRLLESIALFLALYSLLTEPLKLFLPIINRMIANPIYGDIINAILHLLVALISIWLLLGPSRISKVWLFIKKLWATFISMSSHLVRVVQRWLF